MTLDNENNENLNKENWKKVSGSPQKRKTSKSKNKDEEMIESEKEQDSLLQSEVGI